MRNAVIIAFCAVTFAGCYGGPAGELVGVYPREDWVQVNPYGMNYIHYGSFTMGPSDQDVPYALTARSKTVTIPAFYIDIHEISNNEGPKEGRKEQRKEGQNKGRNKGRKEGTKEGRKE